MDRGVFRATGTGDNTTPNPQLREALILRFVAILAQACIKPSIAEASSSYHVGGAF